MNSIRPAAGDAQTQEEMVKAVPMLAEIVAYEDLKVGIASHAMAASITFAPLL